MFSVVVLDSEYAYKGDRVASLRHGSGSVSGTWDTATWGYLFTCGWKLQGI